MAADNRDPRPPTDVPPVEIDSHLQRVLASAGVGTWRFDFRSGALDYSAEVGPMFGEPPGFVHRDVAAWLAALHPADRERLGAAWEALVVRDAPYDLEFRVLGRDGRLRWLATTGRAFRCAEGRPVSAMGIVRDVTALKTLQTQRTFLLTLEDRLRTLECPRAIMREAARLLCEQLRLAQAGYARVCADDSVVVEEECGDGRVPSLAGRSFALAAFGGHGDELRAGRDLAITDVDVDPRTADAAQRGVYRALGTRAFAAIAFLRGERLAGYLYAAEPAPRAWTAEDLALLRETAERTWSAVGRVEAERALRERDAQMTAILNNSGAALYAVGRDGRLLFVNRSFEDFVGLPAAELVGRHLGEVFEAATAAAFLANNEVVMRDGPAEFEESARYGDEVRHYRSVKNPLYDDAAHVIGVVGLSSDVTERRQALEAVERHRQELQTILDLIPVGVAVAHDSRGDWIWVSPRFAELLGTVPGQNASLTGPGRDTVPYRCIRDGVDVPGEALPMQVAARTGREVRDVEFDLLLANGEVRHLMVNAAPLFDADGRVRGAIGAHVDITVLKQAQRELQAADRQKDEFLATLAHELRNPMAPIRYASAMLRRDAPPGVLEQARATIERQSAHMARLLDDLLDVSRITRNVIELRPETVDLREIVREAVDAARPTFDGQRHELTVSAAAGPLWTRGDRTRLLQVVGNLLSNAAKYTPPGRSVHVEVRVEEGLACLRVRDAGIGIPPERLPGLFRLFAQAHTGLAASQGGLGIGLAIARRLVELHGGTIEAHSEGTGRGSEFVVRLPRHEGPADGARSGAGAPEVAAVAGIEVLVVDDNVDAADTLALLLRCEGIPVHVAHDGRTALELAERVRPRIVLLDVGLPDLSGIEVARTLRTRPWATRAVIVAVTGWGQDADRERTQAAGMDLHLVKPVDPDAVLRLVNSAARRAVLEATLEA